MKRKQIAAMAVTGALLAQSAFLSGCAGAQAAQGTDSAESAGAQAETQAAQESAAQQQESIALEETQETAAEEGSAADEAVDAGEAYADGANGFAFRLTRALLEEKSEGDNLVTSPYSVWLPLAALSNAADEESQKTLLNALGEAGISPDALNETVSAMNNALLGKDLAADAAENGAQYESPLKIANALFLGENEPLKDDFREIFEDGYDGKLFSVDFTDPSAVQEINGWAEEQTNGKITELIESLDPSTVAAIANAIYFSDSWATPFGSEDTENGTFYGAVFEEEAPLMRHEFEQNTYYEDETMQATVLPTVSGGQMIVLLPKEGTTPEELLAGMDAQKLDDVLAGDFATVDLTLPRFSLTSGTFSVKEAMEALGITLTDSVNPHLTGLVDGEALYISDAVQKAMIEVDEDGMTASAATVMGIMRMSMPLETEPVEMVCDRPFAFVLTADGREAGPQILFTGVVNQLSQAVACK